MKNTRLTKNQSPKSKLNLLLLGSVLITIFFNSALKDPFNTPKFILLILLGAWCLSLFLIVLPKLVKIKEFKIILILLGIFNAFSLFSALASSNKYASFIGEYQRKNGLLTYLSLTLVFIVVGAVVKLSDLRRIYFSVFITAFIVSGYGFIQHFGNDFVAWNNPYNSVISTVGNPNFASGIMSVFAVIITGFGLNNKNSWHVRLFGFALVCFLLLVIYYSNSRQGMIAFAAGILVLVCVYLYKCKRSLGLIALGFTFILGFFSVLGMLQKGPLAEILYKPSVTLRGYYWRAGIKMLFDHPLFGVGPDRYGAFFKSVRPAEYPLKYGFDITSTNAHNVPIQILSTIGIFGGAAYLILMVIVFVFGLRLLSNNRFDYKLTVPIFAGWVAFQAQSFISIDNVGIAIWGWLLSGIIVGLSISSNSDKELNLKINPNSQASLSVLSAIFVFISFVFCTFLYRGESSMFTQSGLVNVQGQEGQNVFHTAALKTLSIPLLEPQYRVETSYNLAYKGYTGESAVQIDKVLSNDARSQDGLTLKSMAFEAIGDYENAIKVRLEITKLDPWNAKNYLKIGQLYKLSNNLSGAETMLSKILSFAPNTPEASQAKSELKVN
jgi:O-antigen ligase